MNTPAQSVRFVVLFHACREGDHYDLMIESGERLATWKIFDPPESAAGRPLSAQRIGEHRRTYLDYEGPVSGHRGHVTRHDAGRCLVHRQSPEAWELNFFGDNLAGRFILERLGPDDHSWRLRSVSRIPSG